MAKNTIIISHRRDFDGIASAAELLRALDGSIAKILFTNPSKKEMLSTLSKIKGLNNSTLYITDISMPHDGYSDIISLLRGFHSASNEIKWLDHHPWSEDAIKEVREISDMLICGENDKYCAAELVYKNICNSDKTCESIANLAHLTDFNIRPEDKALDADLVKISKCIAFLDNDEPHSDELRMALTESVAKGSISGNTVEQIYSEYKKSEGENIQMLNKTMNSIKSGKYVIGIAFAENLQSNMACAMIKESTGANIQVFVTTKDWSAHVRSDEGIDSSVLSKAFGGNGHPQASGFNIKMAEHEDIKDAILAYTDTVFKAAMKIFN
jgi:oligoribonuclease NrnB/cAMP/cGMP phosphodiesterase (DHH superfamily)